jgi:hypothetical protein
MLQCGEVIYRADQPIESGFVPKEAVIDGLDDGRTVEVVLSTVSTATARPPSSPVTSRSLARPWSHPHQE